MSLQTVNKHCEMLSPSHVFIAYLGADESQSVE
jgi:hypothetical protein